MGTSFTEFKGHGFWTRDAALECFLGHLVVELEPQTSNHAWLDPVLDDWTIQAAAGLIGTVSPRLDWHLYLADRVARVLESAIRVRDANANPKEELAPVGSDFDARANRVFAGSTWTRPEALQTMLRAVGEAFCNLLDGSLLAPTESHLVISAPTSWYVAEPPELVVRRWLVLADSGDQSRPTAPERFLDALEKSAPHWRIDVTRAEPPTLVQAKLTSKHGSETFTILASGVADFFTAFVGGPVGGDWTLMTTKATGSRGVISNLGGEGWRFVPMGLLSRTYDGVHHLVPAERSSATWGDRIFGKSATIAARSERNTR